MGQVVETIDAAIAKANPPSGGCKATTVNRDISALKAMLSKAVEWGDLAVNPLQILKPFKTDDIGVTRFLTESEKRALRRALDNRQDLTASSTALHLSREQAEPFMKVNSKIAFITVEEH